ncbi:MAG: ABC transporter permease, partial [Deltaproteobacteria bacterium]|nr:ABC transporter permease [Deltaproteobacteria bacterium]
KVTVLGALVTLQCAILATMNYVLLQMGGEYAFGLLALNGVTILTGLVGMSMGLFMSSLFSSSEAAVGTLPLVLIPQITFGGLIVKVGNMSLLAKAVSWTMITRYAFEASIKTGEKIWVPKFGAARGEPLKVSGALYDLGFRSSAVDDMGLPILVLILVLVAAEPPLGDVPVGRRGLSAPTTTTARLRGAAAPPRPGGGRLWPPRDHLGRPRRGLCGRRARPGCIPVWCGRRSRPGCGGRRRDPRFLGDTRSRLAGRVRLPGGGGAAVHRLAGGAPTARDPGLAGHGRPRG